MQIYLSNHQLPKLNEEISVQNNEKCIVYGIKEIGPENFVDEDEQELKNENIRKSKYFDKQSLLGFLIDKQSKQIIEFNLAKRIASSLELDICLMREGTQIVQNQKDQRQQQQNQEEEKQNVIISLTRYRQYIYREYYLKELKTKSRKKYIESELSNESLIDMSDLSPSNSRANKNRIKSIRIGQQVHTHDLKNKQSQIKRWLEQGQRKFKVIANNNSEKSQKALQNFCSLFQKQVQISEQKIVTHPKKKAVSRLYAILEFQEEIQIDLAFINRRWRRKQAEIKLNHTLKGKQSSLFDINFTDKDPDMQKAYLAAFQQCGIPYPKQYNFLTDLDKTINKQGLSGFIRQATQENQKKHAQRQRSFQYEGEQQITKEQLRMRDKQNRKIMQIRTVEDILDEMQELKSRQYEMQQYQSGRYKQLQKQLKQMLTNKRHSVEN